jgi:hypothetical protein
MAHTEFEFLKNKVEAARQFLLRPTSAWKHTPRSTVADNEILEALRPAYIEARFL